MKINNFITPEYNLSGIFLRKIKSFVCRNKKYKKDKYDIIQKYWSHFGLNFCNKKIDLKNIFLNDFSSTILEIGFGNGKSLINTATHNKNKNILGIEVYVPGVSTCIKNLYLKKINNVKIILHDAAEVLHYMIQDNSLYSIQCFFPDPWTKKRHHKRRLFQISFIKLILKKIVLGGVLHIVTDCKSYADSILKILKNEVHYINIAEERDFIMKLNLREITKFEKRAFLNGNEVFDLIFKYVKK